jgi:disulfide bond formation protein DsbB
MSSEPVKTPPAGPLTLLALVIAAVTAAGSVLLTTYLGLVACTLCFYQRTFAFAAAGVLAVGVFTGMGRKTALAALTLPLAAGGLAVACFHVWLEVNGTLECPKGFFGLGTAPQQSLAAFALLTLVLLSDAWQDLRAGGGWSASLGGIVLGAVFAYALIVSGPKLAGPPKEPYTEPLKVCRPPYVAES